MKAIRILTLITALFSGGPALAADSAPATPAVSLTGEKAVAQLKESGQYDSIAAAYEAARHAVRADEAEPDGVLHAQNPGHGLSASFDRHGLHLSVQRHGPEGERLTTRWRLDSVGRDGAVEKVPAGDALRRDGQRAEIVRAGLGLTEWFVNRPSGLEHGFTLDRRPAGEGALRLDIAIEGDLSPVPGADGLRIELHDAAGAKVLDYDKLRVWDATGQELPAHMEQAAAGGLRFRVEDAGARYPLTVDPTFNQQAYLKSSNAGASDGFGWSVSVSGDTVVVGAPNEDGDAASTTATPNESAADAGAAYVFVRSGSTWTQQAYLKASNAGAGDGFGFTVAVSGDTVVVGAWSEDSSTTGTTSTPNEGAAQAGAAYVFVRSGSTWTQQAYLKASNTAAGDEFGRGVAVSGDTVVVGAENEAGDAASTAASSNNNAAQAGAAYVFTRSGSTWSQQAYLKASNAGAGDKFYNVAIAGNTVAVGASYERGDAASTAAIPNDNASAAGAAYVFTRSGSTWTQQAYLKASNAGAGDRFGESVAVSGETLAVGAHIEAGDAASTAATPNNNAGGAGAAYVFTRSGSTWTQQAYLKASNTGANDLFGSSVAVDGNTVVVGAPGEASSTTGVNSTPDESALNAGAAYMFVRSGSTWTQQAYIKARNAQAADYFGFDVAVSGGTVVVGADSEDSSTTGINNTPNESATDAGAAYVFSLIPDPTLTSVSPTSGPTAGGTTVTLTGTGFTGFTGTPTVTFRGIAATAVTVVNATTITCTTPAATAGTASVLVTTPGGSNAANTLFTYGAPPSPPTLTSLTPATGTTAGGTTVTLTGTNFTGATGVTFGGTAAPAVIVVNATTITCTTPAGTAGARSVLVTTPGGTNAANTLYTYVAPPSPPTLTSVSPNSGTTAGGTVVTLTGTNFTGATNVTFGGTAATNRTVVNATTITCTTPARAAGTASVLVTTPGGTNAANTLFTYVAPPSPPTLTSVSPNSGSTAGGTTVTLTGTNFTGATNVTFGGTAATNRTVVNATTITCTTPARAAGTASVLVTTPGGTNAANTLFTYVPQQIIGTLNIYWVGLVGPFAGCSAIETTDGTPADAADGNITMSGVSVSDPCISTATYTFTVSPDGLTLTGQDTLFNVPMVLTRTPDQPFFSGLWESGGESFRAYISAAPFTPSPATLTTAAYTGSNPTLNGGALYGFPIVSDAKTLPETLTVTSTSAGTLLSGSSPGMNTGFRTNINMTPPAGQFQVIQTISLALPGAFDDGLRLDYNGQTVLDFDFSNYTNIPAVNSMFGGGWTPWTGEGAPIVLELDARGLRLMVTAASNGTGAAAGVLTGQRVNVLNYFTSDTYVPDPADPDFVSGVQVGLYNRNAGGAWAMPNVTLTATARVIPRHTAQITRAPGGNPSLHFQGMASQSYLIQRSTNLLNWTTIHTANAAANGTLSYTDTTPPAGRAYYRIALP